MASRVTYTTIVSQAWQNVYDLINSNTNVADPVTSSSEHRKWVYNRDPDPKGIGFKGYPYIVVNPATMDPDTVGKQTVDRKSRGVGWTVEVEVVTSDVGANDQEGRGAEWVDEITDDIVQTFLNVTNRDTLRANGMSCSTPQITTVVVEPNDQTLVFRRSIMLNFKTRMQVSA